MYYIDDYEKSLQERGTSTATVNAYLSDIEDFERFLNNSKMIEKVVPEDIENYISLLQESGKTSSTIGRRIASLKSFYKYLLGRNAIKKNPCAGFKAPKREEPQLVYLSQEEIIKLLELPSGDTSGLRDKALLELMYATGMRVSEICSLDISDLNMSIGYVEVTSKGKKRIVPIGRPCKAAIKDYIMHSRKELLGKKNDDGALILSYLGERITRQGIWKILKTYAEKTEFADKVSPQTIRNSFAAHLIQNGADLKSLQELLGHEDIMATKIYLRVAKNRIMDVYDKAFPRA